MTFEEEGILIGAHSLNGFLFVVESLTASDLIQSNRLLAGPCDVTLTFAGWQRFEQLR